MSKRKTKEKAATLEQMAATDFEPWDTEGPWGLDAFNDMKRWRETAQAHLTTYRIAWRAMFLSKDELGAELSKLESEATTDLLEGLSEATQFFDMLAKVTAGLEARVLVASAHHWAKQTGEAA